MAQEDTGPQFDTRDADGNSCPECGRSLDGLDRYAHSLEHWPERIPQADRNNLLARQRQAALLQRHIPTE